MPQKLPKNPGRRVMTWFKIKSRTLSHGREKIIQPSLLGIKAYHGCHLKAETYIFQNILGFDTLISVYDGKICSGRLKKTVNWCFFSGKIPTFVLS